MLRRLALLFILASVQPGQLQEDQPTPAGVAEVFDENKALLISIRNEMSSHIREFHSFREQTEEKETNLQISLATMQSFLAIQSQVVNAKLDMLNSKLELLNVSLPQLQQQTVSKIAQLQNSLTSTNSKLSTLNVATNQLSNNHQQTIERLLLLQNQWNNLTYMLENTECSTTESYTCGGTGGWRRVVYLDMTDPNTTCPSGWQLTGYSKRTCGRVSTTDLSCDSVTFPVSGGEYSRVCGRIKAYQRGHIDAFEAYHDRRVTTIDGAYVAGVSVTHGSPRQHVWTFAAGTKEIGYTTDEACPCDSGVTTHVPPFVGNDYFCESGVNTDTGTSGFHPDDPLWDGQNCTSSSTCCSFNSPPYFVKQLPTSTTDDIEARLCRWEASSDDSPIEFMELYVQ